ISNRSVITVNVSTDESRKEIRKSPGAPSTPANATIFCFHALNELVKRKPPEKRGIHRRSGRSRAASRSPRRLHRKRGAIPRAPSRREEAHTQHSPRAAGARHAP